VYTQKNVTADLAFASPKYLQILLFKVEADWAYAMQMRKVLSAQSSSTQEGEQEESKHTLTGVKNVQRNPNRVKFHVRNKFNRVYKNSQKLMDIGSEVLEKFS
jgi:hypothetical protein